MNGVLSAESAILAHLQTIGVIHLFLHSVVVYLRALSASQSDLNAHNGTSLKIASLYHPGYEKFSKWPTKNCHSEDEKSAQKKPFVTGRNIL